MSSVDREASILADMDHIGNVIWLHFSRILIAGIALEQIVLF